MPAKLKEVINCLNKYYNEKTQEEWDNSGLACGEKSQIVSNIILCLDITDDVIDNAIKVSAELIISHHPILFNPLYSIAGNSYKERLLIKAIKNNIAIYCLHTPADKASRGINYANAEKLGLKNISLIPPKDSNLNRIQFVLERDNAETIPQFLEEYDCSDILIVKDICNRLAVQASTTDINLNICIKNLQNKFGINTVNICPTKNSRTDLCNFIIGEISEMNANEFIKHIKKTFGLEYIYAGGYLHNSIKKVAVCGGAGKSFLNDVISYKADAYITGDLSHHAYQHAYENKIMLLDATHYNSEKVFLEIIQNTLIYENIGFNCDNIKCIDQQNYFNKLF